MKILKGHVSPETAYVVNDYPYGFRLRCKIRYWLEENKNGARLWSQTTNPKKAGEVWNKPKASTYALIAGCMFLNEDDHVVWSGLTQYEDTDQAIAWYERFKDGLSDLGTAATKLWIEKKKAYDEIMAKHKSTS